VKDGVRYRVMFRLGGRESAPRYAGAFKTMREAKGRRDFVAGELAAMRVPDLRLTARSAPTLATVAEQWRASRVDVSEGTRVLHRVALGRVLPILGDRTIDTLTGDDVAHLIERLVAAGKKRETIRKSVKYLAVVLDFAGVDPNPARDKQRVRLPYEELEEMNPPTAAHVEAIYRLLAPARISLLHRQGRSWAEIARFVGQRKLSITADTYSHVMSDGEEVEYASLV